MYTQHSLTKHVGAMCFAMQNAGNNHPNLNNVMEEFIALSKARGSSIPANLASQIEDAFKELRPYFFDFNVLVVPYNVLWDIDKYPKPKTEWEARLYLTGPHRPIYGIYFVVDKDDSGDMLYMAYCNREDLKGRNKQRINDRRQYLGIDQDFIPEKAALKRIQDHSEKSVEELTNEMNAIRRLIHAKKKPSQGTV